MYFPSYFKRGFPGRSQKRKSINCQNQQQLLWHKSCKMTLSQGIQVRSIIIFIRLLIYESSGKYKITIDVATINDPNHCHYENTSVGPWSFWCYMFKGKMLSIPHVVSSKNKTTFLDIAKSREEKYHDVLSRWKNHSYDTDVEITIRPIF